MRSNNKWIISSAQFLVVLSLTACGSGGGTSSNSGNNTGGGSGSYSISGTVSGLTGSVVLQDNGGNDLTVAANGNFTFTTPVTGGTPYNVTVLTQPSGQTCTVSGGSGTVSANVTNVLVSCSLSGDQYGTGPDPVPDPTGNPTSNDLIDAAKTASTITAEQALLYKTYAEFGDSRLPVQYQGDDTGYIEGDALQQAASYIASVGINNVSTSTLDALGPFLVPAYYEGSWWNQQNPSATAKSAIAPGRKVTTKAASNPNCRAWETNCSQLAEWKNVAGSNVVVWYLTANETADWPKAVMLVQEYDSTIWPRLTGLMGRTPLSDVGSGGMVSETDGRYDVLLVDLPASKEGVTVTNYLTTCQMQSTHIYLSRNLSNQGLIAQAAHEFMHALQFSTPLAACVNNYYTIQEATAAWATNFVYPKNDWEQKYAKHYLTGPWPAESYDYRPSAPSLFRYGAYVFPLFLQSRFGPSIVKRIWDAAHTETDELKAIDNAIRAVGSGSSFAKEWPRFAAANWNREALSKTYWNMDILVENVDHLESDDSFALSGGTGGLKHQVSIKHAAAAYYRVVFNDTSARSVMIVNGLDFKADTLNQTGWGKNLAFTGLSSLERRGASMQVFLKVDGAWLNGSTDLSNVPWTFVCRDDPAGKIDEMIVIYANAEIDPSAPNYTGLFPRSQSPGIFATDIGCRDWTGSLSMSRPLTGGIETLAVTGVTLKNALPTAAPLPGDGPAYSFPSGQPIMPGFGWVYAYTTGSAKWTYNAYDSGCTDTGSKTFDISNPAMPIVTNSAFAPTGTANHGMFIPGFLSNALQTVLNLSYDWICVDNQGKVTTGTSIVGTGLDVAVIINDNNVRITGGGLSVSGTGAQTSDSTVTGTWSLTGKTN